VSFIVETGSGDPNATSYVDLTTANSYFADRAVTAQTGSYAAIWATMTDPDKQAALVNATFFIDAKYGERFRGRRILYEQALSWPRYGATVDGDGSEGFIPGFGPTTFGFIIPSDAIPVWLKRAVIEMAARCYKNVAAPDIAPGAGYEKMIKLGPLEKEYQGPFIPYVIWRYVDMLLTPILKHGGSNATIIRS
jgi:hypothetical protein